MSTDAGSPPFLFDRRAVLKGALAWGAAHAVLRAATSRAAGQAEIDATFVFASDIHACRMGSGLSPHCAAEGKTDESLRRHIAAINRLPEMRWPQRDRRRAVRPRLRRQQDRQAVGRGDRRRHDRRRRRPGRASGRRNAAPAIQPSLPGGAGTGPRPFSGLCRPRQPRPRPGRSAAAGRLVPPRAARLCRDQPSPERDLQAAGAGRQLRSGLGRLFLGLGRAASGADAPLRRRPRQGRGERHSLAEAGSGEQCRRRPARHPVPALWLGQILARALGSGGQHFRRCRQRAAALVERRGPRRPACSHRRLQCHRHLPRPSARDADDLPRGRARPVQAEGKFHGRLCGGAGHRNRHGCGAGRSPPTAWRRGLHQRLQQADRHACMDPSKEWRRPEPPVRCRAATRFAIAASAPC